jgi:hypothetical protein
MQFLLDTNICIYIIKRKPQKVFERFQSLNPGEKQQALDYYHQALPLFQTVGDRY